MIKFRYEANLSPDEIILRDQRPNALITFYLPLAGVFLAAVLAIGMMLFLLSALSVESFVLKATATGTMLLAGTVWAASIWLKWTTSWLTLTDKRLIESWFVLHKLGPEHKAFPLAKIQNVDFSQNIIEGWADTGDITISTAANANPMVLRNVDGLTGFMREIDERLNELNDTSPTTDTVNNQSLLRVMERLIETLQAHNEALHENTAALKRSQKPPSPPPEAWQF